MHPAFPAVYTSLLPLSVVPLFVVSLPLFPRIKNALFRLSRGMDRGREKESVKVHHRFENYAGHNFAKARVARREEKNRSFSSKKIVRVILINPDDREIECNHRFDFLVEYNDLKSSNNS